MRIYIIILIVNCFIFGSCNKNTTNPQAPGVNEIWLVYKNFRPQQLQITVGTTINFMNKDNSSHTATGNGNLFYSGKLAPGSNYEFTFNTPGLYSVYCNFHSSVNTEQCLIEVK